MILIPGADIINKMQVIQKSKAKKMTFDSDTNIPFNYYYNQTIDLIQHIHMIQEETPITREENYPFFEKRYDRPTTFDGTSILI